MDILILPSSDGAFNQIRPEYELFIRLMERGHRITIVLKPDSAYMPRLRELGIRTLHCYPQRKICLSSIIGLRRELASRHYDIFYANCSIAMPNATLAAIGYPVKLVTYRGTTGGAYWHDPTNYLTVLSPRADGIVCVSEAVRQYLLPRFTRRRTRLVTIYKGHDLAWYDRPPADLSEFGITAADFTVACVANARPYKGLRYLLEAAKKLYDIDNLHILLIGRNINVEPYTSLVAASGMAERIHITGFRHDAPELIAACKTLVLPSLREGLPRVVLESMGYGIPPIVTDSGGPAEIVVDDRNGFVVPTRDPDAIAAKVRHLYEHPEVITRLSAACIRTIENDMSIERTADRYSEFFSSLIAADE